MKTCTKCQRNLDLTNYSPDKRNIDGMQSHCNDCRRAYKQVERNKRKEGIGLISKVAKTCNKCLQTKSIDEFFKDMGLADGHGTICKQCKQAGTQLWRERKRQVYNDYMKTYRQTHPEKYAQARNRGLKHRYGIDSAQYEMILARQNGGCAICKKQPSKRKLVVDHSHLTKEVRGLLCTGCNTAIAILDNPVLLAAVKAYLHLT